jgi:hypothetical protein
MDECWWRAISARGADSLDKRAAHLRRDCDANSRCEERIGSSGFLSARPAKPCLPGRRAS